MCRALPEVPEIRLTRQGLRIYNDEMEIRDKLYRIVGEPPTGRCHRRGRDGPLGVDQGFASLTPIHLDLTAHHFVSTLANWDIRL